MHIYIIFHIKMGKRKISLIAFFVLLVTLTVFMLIPSPPTVFPKIRFLDKVEHFSAFFVLTSLLLVYSGGISLKKRRFNLIFPSMLICYGILIEFLQGLTGRSIEVSDVIADVIGIAFGCILSLFFL